MGISNRINLQLEPEQFQYVETVSMLNGTNKSQFLRNIIQQYIDTQTTKPAQINEQASTNDYDGF